MSTNGMIIWQKSFPTNFRMRSVCCSPDSSIYILAHFEGQLFLGNSQFKSHGKTDLCLFRLSAAGNVMWGRQIGSKEDDFGGSIAMHGVDVVIAGSSGDTTYLPGYIQQKKQLEEFFAGRFFANGNLDTVVFSDVAPIYQDEDGARATEVTVDHLGNVIAVIKLTGRMQIDTSVVQEYKGIFIYKFSSGFKHQWHTLLSNFYDDAKEIKITSQKEIIF